MDNLVADFTININEPLQAEFVLGNSQTFDCSFELFAAGTVWGSIDGDISNQTDLKNALDSKADASIVNELSEDLTDLATTVSDNYTALENDLTSLSTTVDNNYLELSNRLLNDEQTTSDLIGTVANNYTELNGKISTNTGNITSIQNTINSYGDIVSYNATDFATASQGALADTALQSGDNITELVNNAGYITGINSTDVTNALGYTPYNSSNPAGYITSADLPTLEDLTTQAQMNTINSGATSVNIAQIASNTQAISTETLNRQNADNGLQSQIDAIVASSDVFDIVGTYAELQAYDISTVPPNDIIKVLVDSTHNNAATYYRCVETGGVKSWSYIGSEGAYYTKSEADGRFVPLERTINGKALSNNITLDATDVGALPSSTVIPTVNNGTLNIQVNGTSVGTFTANQSGNTTANIVVPDSATWGNITGDIEDQTDLQTALDDKQDKLTAGTDLEIVEGSILPNSYTQLTSITSTGTQWINSGIKLTNNFKSIIVGRLTGTPATNFRTILGANNNNLSTGKQNVLLGWGNSANGFYAEPCTMPSYTYSSYPWNTNTHTFTTTVTPTVTTLNIDGVVDTINSAPSITGVNLAIFARLAQDNTVGSQVNFELNSIELYQSGSLVFKGVPAKRNSDDEVGLYDTVSGSFFSNSGTGDFVAGSEVPAITVINFTNDTGYITGINSTDVTNALGYTPVNPSNLATVATSGDYDDLTNKPTIPTVGDGTITITQGGVTKGTFTTNQSGNSTIALDAGGSGGSYSAGTGIVISNDTISIDTSVVAQLSDIPTNYVTTDTAQNISGRKTFLGEKAIYFKQSATTDKLGFTLYNSSNTELGAFEWRPSTISGGALLNINVPYSSSNYVGFRYWGTAVNIIAPKVATAGNYYIPTHITDGTNTVTANSSGTVDISSLLPNVSGYLENTATGTDSLTILGTPTTGTCNINIGTGSQTPSYDCSIAIGAGETANQLDGAIASDYSIAIGSGYDVYNGANADANSIAIGTGANAANYSVALGFSSVATNVSGTAIALGSNSLASGEDSIALGKFAEATAREAYQIGEGTNNTAYSLQVGNIQLLNTATSLIPDARLSSNIARTSQIPTVPTNISAFTNDSGYITSASLPTMTYTSATETLTFG